MGVVRREHVICVSVTVVSVVSNAVCIVCASERLTQRSTAWGASDGMDGVRVKVIGGCADCSVCVWGYAKGPFDCPLR